LLYTLTGLFQINILSTIIISFILSSLTYPGDVLILPKISNITAIITDFLLIVFIISLLGLLLIKPFNVIGPASIFSGIFMIIGELYFHRYMQERILVHHDHKNFNNNLLQTEFSNELIIGEEESSQFKEK